MFSVYKKIVSPESSPILSPVQSPTLHPTQIAPVIEGDISFDLGPAMTGPGTEFLNTACKCCASHRSAIVRTATNDADPAVAAAATASSSDALLTQYINLNYPHSMQSTHSTHYQYRAYRPREINAFDDVLPLLPPPPRE